VSRRKPGNLRGFALIMVLMFVVVLLILIGALLDFMPIELSQASYTGYDDRSLYAADSGVQYATESLENAAASGFFPTPAPMPAGTPFATVYLDSSPGPSASPDAQVWIQASSQGSGLATYYVTSIGYWHGISHRVDAVVAQRPFNSRAFVAKNNARGNYFVSGLMSFDGPVYLEGNPNDVNIQWYNNVVPVFGDDAEISGNYKWFGPGGKAGVAPVGSQWKFVDAKGKSGITFVGPGSLAFPSLTDTDAVGNEAWSGSRTGSTLPIPPSKGVFMDQHLASQSGKTDPSCNGLPQVDSGIFVEGDANISMTSTATTQTFALTPTGSGNSYSPTDNVTITIDFTANTTNVNDVNAKTGKSVSQNTYCGTPSGDPQGSIGANGVLFVDGDVKGISGTVHGAYTVAVPDNTTSGSGANDIIINGAIRYQNDPDAANKTYCNCQSADMLGLYGHDIKMSQSIPAGVQIEAALFAGNSADVAIKNTDGAFMVQGKLNGMGIRGVLNVYGSVVQNFVMPLGVFDPRTGLLVDGWGDTYNWDRRFTSRVPPGMPESDKYSIVAWKDVGVP